MQSPIMRVEKEETLSSAYVMLNIEQISAQMVDHISVFHICDDLGFGFIRRIIGYCTPLESYRKNFNEAPSLASIIMANIGRDVQGINEFQERYKFVFPPLFAEPSHPEEFQRMLKSDYAPLQNHRTLDQMICTINKGKKKLSGDGMTLLPILKKLKFKLSLNPHLIPTRLPNGIECYQLLDLAEHCRNYYERGVEREFGHYHFREYQIELGRRHSRMREGNNGQTPSQPSTPTSQPCSSPNESQTSNGTAEEPAADRCTRLTYAQAASSFGRQKKDDCALASPAAVAQEQESAEEKEKAPEPPNSMDGQQQSDDSSSSNNPVPQVDTLPHPQWPISYAQIVSLPPSEKRIELRSSL